MEHETKFNLDDSVWFMYGNEVVNKKIQEISFVRFLSPVRFNIEENEQYTVYGIAATFSPEYLFRTKEELIKSL